MRKMISDIFSGAGDIFGDASLRMQGRNPEEHAMKLKHMQALLNSEAGQKLLRDSQITLNAARTGAINRGEGLYGGRREDPYVKGSEDLGKIRAARDEFAEEEMTPETASYFEAAEQSVLDRMKKPEDPLTGWTMPVSEAPKGKVDEVPTSKSAAEYFQQADVGKAARAGFEMVAGQADFAKAGRAVSDYFQSSTDTVPEENIPKTYQQLGIESVDDMAIIDEMQKALPERDMKAEYEDDPENMQKLMMLWKKGKLNKSNLHKAFSALQQRARESLGVA